ncbi:MAG: helix-turn-helix domain-containing protein [Neisseria sp.]|uniref:helix-turn-helix domain-containing protein n=1 Tax=Neisseria sp. TaxID=192066 RepID=UPI0026DDB141|nr:helix-turn-helix domain-containing protein [Neisseria sp.]MDO4640786.1 helix-turn-helix domain-containing protein [Neisseria sp.]
MQKETARNTQDISDGHTQSRHSTPPSQNERILAVLKSGRTLTAYDMHQMGIMGCNARIHELRLSGHNITCTMENIKNQYGQTVKRGRYRLIQGKDSV